jgi:hypothetical protein
MSQKDKIERRKDKRKLKRKKEREGERKIKKNKNKEIENERERELFPPPRPRGLTRYLSRHLIPVMVQTPSWLISGNETIFMVCTSPPPSPTMVWGRGGGYVWLILRILFQHRSRY